MRAPLAPSGWPSAIAPPSTFVRSRGSPSSFSTAVLRRERLVHLHEIHVRERRAGPRERVADRRHRADAHDGRIDPGVAQLTTRAMGVTPRRCAYSRVATTSAPAPSATPLAAPAWMTPSF